MRNKRITRNDEKSRTFLDSEEHHADNWLELGKREKIFDGTPARPLLIRPRHGIVETEGIFNS